MVHPVLFQTSFQIPSKNLDRIVSNCKGSSRRRVRRPCVELSAQDRQCCRLGELPRSKASGATGRGFCEDYLFGGDFCDRFAPCDDPTRLARPVMACFAARVGNSGMVSNWLGPISDPCQDHAKWSITARQVTANNELRCIYGVAEVVSLMHGDSLTQSRRRR